MDTADTTASPRPDRGRITGKVFNADGSLAAGVTVAMFAAGGPDMEYVSVAAESVDAIKGDASSVKNSAADGRGRFEFSNLAWGWYTIVAGGDSSVATHTTMLDAVQSPQANLTLILQACGSIDGVVCDEEGNGIAGATLTRAQQNGEEFPWYKSAGLVVKSGPKGTFHVGFLSPKTWVFYVAAAGYAPCVTDALTVGTTNAKVVLGKGVSITGRVVDAQTGQGVGKLRLIATPELRRTAPSRASAEDDGSFTFAHVAAGRYTLLSEDPALVLVDSPVAVEVRPGGGKSSLTLRAGRGAVISGKVYDSVGGDGAPGVKMVASTPVRGLAPRYSAPTSSTGLYEIRGLAPGNYLVVPFDLPSGMTMVKPDRPQPIAARLGETYPNVDYQLATGPVISGVVTDTKQRPVGHVRVSARTRFGNRRTGSADELGKFTIRGYRAGDQVTLRAETADVQSSPQGPFEVPEEGLADIRLVMERPVDGVIAGQVVDSSGRPFRAAVVWRSQDETSQFAPNDFAETDYDGYFVNPVVTPGDYSIRIGPRNADGRIRAEVEAGTIHLGAGQSRTGLRLVYDDRTLLKISGRVTNPAGNPVKSAGVNTMVSGGSGESPTSATSDADGYFELLNVSDGPNYIVAHHPDYGAAVREGVPAGATNVNLVLTPNPQVSGVVLDSVSRKPLAEFEIALVSQFRDTAPDDAYRKIFDSQGRFSIPIPRFSTDTASVPYSIVARAPDHLPGRFDFGGFEEGQSYDGVEIRLDRGSAKIEGIVRDTERKPVQGVFIFQGPLPETAERQAAKASAQTGSDGTFLLESAALDLTVLSAYRDGYAPATVPVRPESGKTVRVEITLGAEGFVEGAVTQAGRPVEGAVISTEPRADHPVRTGVDGRYQVKGLPTGQVTVRAQLYAGAKPPVLEQQATVEYGAVTTLDFAFP